MRLGQKMGRLLLIQMRNQKEKIKISNILN